MSYRNKTYIAFASEDIVSYRLMTAWKVNDRFDFNFYNAHDLFIARDTSNPTTIKRNLRERLKNAKQIILLGSPDCKRKGGDGDSFLAYEIEVILEFDLPIVIANLSQERTIVDDNIPSPILDARHFTVSVSFQPKIIQHALDHYVDLYADSKKEGSHQYSEQTYTDLGL